MLKDFPLLVDHHTFIVSPIFQSATPVAALGIFSRDVIHPDAESEAFLQAVGSVFSMHMFRQDSNGHEHLNLKGKQVPSNSGFADNELTERQHIILRLISEDRTNLVISEILGYSESSVRQETIKIYAKLRCAGRKEASEIYRQHFANSKEK